MLISVQNDVLTPYSSPVQIGSGWIVNYRPTFINIIPSTMVGSVYVNTVLAQTFTSNQGGQFSVSLVAQLDNRVNFATFNTTTGLISAVWVGFPSPPDSFVIVASYSYNTSHEDPAFFPSHVDGN